jgi:hypothetical protein
VIFAMPFAEFLRTTVLLSAGAATVLALVTLAAANNTGDTTVLVFALAWWGAASLIGAWVGRRVATSPQIASLLAGARTQPTMPELRPGSTLINRLWPLLICTVGAGALAVLIPQVPAVAAGFAIIFALAWRHQSAAVRAIEERDGARFYVQRTSPWQPIKLVRTPGFRSNLTGLNSARRTPVGPAT